MAAAPPTLGGVPTPSGAAPKKTTRAKHRATKKGAARSTVPASRHTKPGSKAYANPPLAYNVGPFTVKVIPYTFRLWAVRGNKLDRILLQDVETVTWDDSSAILTGSLTMRVPRGRQTPQIAAGHEVLCTVSDDGGRTFAPLWRMRVKAPRTDLAQQERTFDLANDLTRMQDSDADFVFAKGKAHPGGWRVDRVLRTIFTSYGFEVAQLPRMTTRITNWHLTDQRPLDVAHSALLREKKTTGAKYAVSLDAKRRVHVYPFRRPRHLLQVGPTLLAASLAAEQDERFATTVTVRAAALSKVGKDKKGHRKVQHVKIAADARTPAGVRLHGVIHRNLYSPDAESNADARHEGRLFLSAVAKPKRTLSATLPGMPFLRRLDAIRFRLTDPAISQIVYVTDANHTLDGNGGYTTEVTLAYDDPFVDNKAQLILNKLSDTAIARSRKTTAKKKAAPKPKAAKPRSVAKPSTLKPPPTLGGVATSATSRRKAT